VGLRQHRGGARVILRGYQKRLLAAAKAEIDAGRNRVLAVMATGGGKTATAVAAVKARVKRGQRVVWVAHRRELIRQAVDTLHAYGVPAGHGGLASSAQTQVISPQGALARGSVPPADFVVPDECHHYVGGGNDWGRLLEAYPSADMLGLTATPARGDGQPLDGTFHTMVLGPQARELVDMGYLVPVETHYPERVQPPGKLAQEPVDAYLGADLRGKRNIVFAPDTQNAERFAAGFRAKGIRTAILTDKTPTAERDRMLLDFADGRIHVLCNLFILTEGSDLPFVSVITLARPFPTASGYIQAGGRGLRICEGKTRLTLLDLVGAYHLHGDLLDEREYSLTGDPIRRKDTSGPSFCRVCGCLLEDCGCGATAENAMLYGVTNDPLVKFARVRKDDSDARALRMSRWIHESTARGHKWTTALFRFKATYGAGAPTEVISQAKALAEGKTWCRQCGTSQCVHALAKGAA
jgi:DNA repair protein RadD